MGKSDRTCFTLAKGFALLGILVYFLLATYRSGSQSIWYDEGLTLHYSLLPLLDGLGELSRQSVHPPFYFALMHFWLGAAGDSDYALRFVSAAFGALLVAASFGLGARLVDRRLGAVLALVTATSPFVVYYGQEARMYTAVALFCTLSAVALIGVVRKGSGFGGYAIASSLAVLTHYFAFLVLGSQLVVVAPLLVLQRRWGDLAKWLGSLAIAGLSFVPWAMNLFRVAATHEDFWRAKLTLVAMAQDAVLHFSLGEVAWSDNQMVHLFYVAAGLGLLGVLRRSLRTGVLVMAATLVVSFLALAAFPKATYVARYMLVVAPAFYLLVAAGVYNLAGLLNKVAGVPAKASIPRRRSQDRRLQPEPALGAPAKASDPGDEFEAVSQDLSFQAVPGLATVEGDYDESLVGPSSRRAPAIQRLEHVLRMSAGYTSFCLAVILALLLLGSNAISLLANYNDPSTYRREDFRSLAEYMAPKLKTGDGMVFVAGPLNYALFHYLPETTPYVSVDSNVKLKPEDDISELNGFLRRDDMKRVWLVRSRVSADDLVDPDRVTRGRVIERFGVVTALKDVRGLVVEAYDGELYDHYKAGRQVDISYGDEVRLARHRVGPGPVKPGDRLEVELFWEPTRPVSRLLWVSLQLVERESGQMVALADFPAGHLVPTTTWSPGMRISDKAVLTIPPDASSGDYDAYLIVYDPATRAKLGVAGGPPGSSADVAKLFAVKVAE